MDHQQARVLALGRSLRARSFVLVGSVLLLLGPGAGEAMALWDVGSPTQLQPFFRLAQASAKGVSGTRIVGSVHEPFGGGTLRIRAAFWDTSEARSPFHTLPDFGGGAEATAADGPLIVGRAEKPGDDVAVVWDTDEPGTPVHVLPDVGSALHGGQDFPRATGVSGNRIVGVIPIPGTDVGQAAFWDTAEPGSPPHLLPGLGVVGATANGVSGNVIVGTSAGRAVFWDAAEPGTPAHGLPDLGGGNITPRAMGVSGTRIVGLVGVPSSNQSRAAYWDVAEPGIPLHLLPSLGQPSSGDIAMGVSGSRIVGTATGAFMPEAVFWDTGEPGTPAHVLPTLGGFFQAPSGVSGTLIVGQAQDAIGNAPQAVFWDAAEPGVPAHVLPANLEAIGGVEALGVSGNLVVGQAIDLTRRRAVMWDTTEPGSPPHALPDLGGFGDNKAAGISGTVIVGQADDPVRFRSVAVFWRADEPAMPVHVLPDLGGGINQATAVSGTLIVGASVDSASHSRAVFWDTDEPGIPVHILPDLGGIFAGASANAVSGTLIVGRVSNPATDTASAAFWDTAEPGQPIHVLPELGSFNQASGVSGTLIVGEANEPTGRLRAVYWDAAEPGRPVHVLPDFDREARASGVSGSLIAGAADDQAVFWDLAALGNAPNVLPDLDVPFSSGKAVAVSATRIVGQPGALVWDLVPNFIESFTATSTVGSDPIVGVPVAFEVTVDDPSNVSLVEWDFDGDATVDQTTTALTSEYTYATAGTYPASVTVSTSDGEQASATTTVMVRSAGVAILDFAFTSTLGSDPITGVPVAFWVTVDDPSRVSLVEWDFDGNGTVDQTTATLTSGYTYATAGSYPASVTVVAREGGRTSATRTVTVRSPSQAIDTAKFLVQQLPLGSGQKNSLTSKLNDAQHLLAKGNMTGACNKLRDVAAYVNGLVSKHDLDPFQASPVLSEVRAIQSSIGCR